MAKTFSTGSIPPGYAHEWYADFLDPLQLSLYLKRHPLLCDIHDAVMAEFHKPMIALVWECYRPESDPTKKEKYLQIFGVDIISPAEAVEMRYTVKSQSFINKN